MTEKKQSKAAIGRNLTVLLFLLIASWIIWLNLQKRVWISQENQAIQHMEDGKLGAAVLLFLQLRQHFRREKDLQRIDRYLADCYLQLAEAPGNSTEVSLLYYRRLFRLDPTRVPESVRMRLHRRDAAEEN